MKSKTIISVAIAACLTLCAAVWPQHTTDRQMEPSPTSKAIAPPTDTTRAGGAGNTHDYRERNGQRA